MNWNDLLGIEKKVSYRNCKNKLIIEIIILFIILNIVYEYKIILIKYIL